MSKSDLRDRVAAAIRRAAAEQTYWIPGPVLSKIYAEAVIDDLKLGQEYGCGSSDIRHGCRCSHRYVTEWVVNE